MFENMSSKELEGIEDKDDELSWNLITDVIIVDIFVPLR